jgi:hypothetical protein
MRSDRESAVIATWLSLSLVLFAFVVYTGIGSGDWAALIAIFVAGELILAGLGTLGLRLAKRRR